MKNSTLALVSLSLLSVACGAASGTDVTTESLAPSVSKKAVVVAPASEEAVDTSHALMLASEKDLPSCSEKNSGALVYTQEESQFLSCIGKEKSWKALDLKGKDGSAGVAGSNGLNGASGSNGLNGTDNKIKEKYNCSLNKTHFNRGADQIDGGSGSVNGNSGQSVEFKYSVSVMNSGDYVTKSFSQIRANATVLNPVTGLFNKGSAKRNVGASAMSASNPGAASLTSDPYELVNYLMLGKFDSATYTGDIDPGTITESINKDTMVYTIKLQSLALFDYKTMYVYGDGYVTEIDSVTRLYPDGIRTMTGTCNKIVY
jgi:hypothetical protein